MILEQPHGDSRLGCPAERSSAISHAAKNLVELRSTRQPRVAVSTWSFLGPAGGRKPPPPVELNQRRYPHQIAPVAHVINH